MRCGGRWGAPDADLPSRFEETNKEVQRRVTDYARELDEKPIVIALWDGKPGDGRGGTADAVHRWRADGYVVDVIDPNLSEAAKA